MPTHARPDQASIAARPPEIGSRTWHRPQTRTAIRERSGRFAKESRGLLTERSLFWPDRASHSRAVANPRFVSLQGHLLQPAQSIAPQSLLGGVLSPHD
eukprot:5475065-Prymnesium_polylepis.1